MDKLELIKLIEDNLEWFQVEIMPKMSEMDLMYINRTIENEMLRYFEVTSEECR
jgi:hypothetical protein